MVNDNTYLKLEDSIGKALYMASSLLENYDLDKEEPTQNDDFALAFNRNNILTEIRILTDYIVSAKADLANLAKVEGGVPA